MYSFLRELSAINPSSKDWAKSGSYAGPTVRSSACNRAVNKGTREDICEGERRSDGERVARDASPLTANKAGPEAG